MACFLPHTKGSDAKGSCLNETQTFLLLQGLMHARMAGLSAGSCYSTSPSLPLQSPAVENKDAGRKSVEPGEK